VAATLLPFSFLLGREFFLYVCQTSPPAIYLVSLSDHHLKIHIITVDIGLLSYTVLLLFSCVPAINELNYFAESASKAYQLPTVGSLLQPVSHSGSWWR